MRAASNVFSPRALARSLHAILVPALLFSIGSPFVSAKSSLLDSPAPDFVLADFSGQSVDLAHFRGKVVLLNFWATWCAPCEVEMPTFAAWQRQYGPQGFQVIGISMDDDPAAARKLADRLKLDYPVAMGDVRLAKLYGGVLGLPLTFLIDRRGFVRARFEGETNAGTIEKQVESLLVSPHLSVKLPAR